MTTSISGLASGLDTQTIISQLMKLEAAGQTRLKSKVTKEEGAVTAYQGVNSKLAALETAAENVGKFATWRSAAATSTHSSVTTATTNSNNSATGSITFDVTSLARAQVYTLPVAKDGDATGDAQMVFTVGGEQKVVDLTGAKTSTAVASAVNNANIGIKASVVTLADGSTVLQMAAAKTGVANGFSIDAGISMNEATAASDASIRVGGAGLGGYDVTSATNTFTDLVAGSSITVSKEGETGITVNVESDVNAISDKVKAMVDAANAALTEIGKQTRFDSAASTSGALGRDYSVRQISQRFLSSVSQAGTDLTGFATLSELGISLTRDGTLSYDATKFKESYKADPTSVETSLTKYATKVKDLADTSQTDVTASINGRKKLIDTMNDQIDDWSLRLSARQDALKRQFASLETAMSKMQSQSSWLASQISSLG